MMWSDEDEGASLLLLLSHSLISCPPYFFLHEHSSHETRDVDVDVLFLSENLFYLIIPSKTGIHDDYNSSCVSHTYNI